MLDKEELLQNSIVMKFLQEVVKRKDLKEEISLFNQTDTHYTNRYYLYTILEFLVKYKILHKDVKDITPFVEELQDLFKTITSYKVFLIGANRLLAKSIQKKLNLEDLLHIENKKKVLEYAYQNYIVEGYCFHSFPSSKTDIVKKDGLFKNKIPYYKEMLEVNKIFEKYHAKNIFGIDLKTDERDYFELTDSPSAAFFYADETPFYFSNFIMGNAKILGGDLDTYLRKDFVLCSNNVELLCNHKNLSLKEKEVVMNYFKKTWDLLNSSNQVPTIAVIERKKVGRDSLDDYQEIVNRCEEQDIIYSLSKIMDSRYPNDRRYTKILPSELKVMNVPTYQEIINYEEKIEEFIEPREEEIIPNNHGHADVIALSGVLLIALGCTWFIISICFGVR